MASEAERRVLEALAAKWKTAEWQWWKKENHACTPADCASDLLRWLYEEAAPPAAGGERAHLAEALKKLRNEVSGLLSYAEMELREAIGNTNLAVLKLRVEEADAALAAPPAEASAPRRPKLYPFANGVHCEEEGHERGPMVSSGQQLTCYICWLESRVDELEAAAPSHDEAHDEAVRVAEAKFTEYFVANYPGPHTVITDPKWHAPKIFRAAVAALVAEGWGKK